MFCDITPTFSATNRVSKVELEEGSSATEDRLLGDSNATGGSTNAGSVHKRTPSVAGRDDDDGTSIDGTGGSAERLGRVNRGERKQRCLQRFHRKVGRSEQKWRRRQRSHR